MGASVCLSLILSLGGASVGGAGAAVVVRSDTDCPSASAVVEALTGLLAPASAVDAPDIVQLRRDGGALGVTLTEAAGSLIAERRLDQEMPCGESARTVAVMVAAWETRLRAGQQAILPRIERPASVTARSLPSPPPLPPGPAPGKNDSLSPVPAASVAPATAPRRPVPVVHVAKSDDEAPVGTADEDRGRPLELETRAGLLMSIANGTIAPAATCDVSFSRRGSRFALAVGALVVGTHGTTVVPGSAAWRRLGGVVDLRSTLRWNALDLEMHGAATLTALTVTGVALPVTAGATLFDPGLLVGIRSRFRLGRLSPWIEATTAFWPLSHSLYVDGTASSRQLPSFEALLGLGVSFGQTP